jgi:hypothetical protein
MHHVKNNQTIKSYACNFKPVSVISLTTHSETLSTGRSYIIEWNLTLTHRNLTS